MLTQQTLHNLRRLKLAGMAEAFERQLAQPSTHDLSFEERLGLLVDCEVTYRENRRLVRLLKQAKLRQDTAIEDLDYQHPRGLEKQQMAVLVSCDWIRARQNVVISGPTGCGKTWIACALGHAACRQGLSVFYVRVSRLFEELKIAHGDGSFGKRLAHLAKLDLLILDDFGLQPCGQTERHDLLEVIEDRHGMRATMVTSQLPLDQWHEYLGNPTVADAVLDRLLHNAYRLALRGESMRKNRFDWFKPGTQAPVPPGRRPSKRPSS